MAMHDLATPNFNFHGLVTPKEILIPNPKEYVETIRSYAMGLVKTHEEYPEQKPDNPFIYHSLLGEAILKHEYQLSTVNWVHNFDVHGVFSKELENVLTIDSAWEWYASLHLVINEWLKKHCRAWVIEENPFNTTNMEYFWQQYLCRTEKFKNATVFPYQEHDERDIDIQDLAKLINSGHGETMFRETFHLLDFLLGCSGEHLIWLKEENKNNEGFKIPIAFVIDPFFLSITFIH